MTTFDPARHHIVARVNDSEDPDFRQEVHVELGDLIGEARKLLADQARELVPQPAPQSTAVVEVPAFEERKIAALENRLATALVRIDELEEEARKNDALSAKNMEMIRSAIFGRVDEMIKDHIHAAMAQHSAIVELRETVDRVSKETAPTAMMQKLAKVTADVANVHKSTAEMAAVFEAVVNETKASIHGELARLTGEVATQIDEARDLFRADMVARIDSAFSSKRSA